MHTIPATQRRERMRVDNPWWESAPPQIDSFYRGLRPRAYFRRFAQLLAAALRLKSVEAGAGRFTDFLLPPAKTSRLARRIHNAH